MIIVSERKRTFQFVCQAQEVCMHTVPLGVLSYFNDTSTESYVILNLLTVIVPLASLVITFSEVTTLQIYANKGINLEHRLKLRSHTRLLDN